jgi:hypothetical protein
MEIEEMMFKKIQEPWENNTGLNRNEIGQVFFINAH